MKDHHLPIIANTPAIMLDMNKVKGVEDIKLILEGLKLSFHPSYEKFDDVKHLLVDPEQTLINSPTGQSIE